MNKIRTGHCLQNSVQFFNVQDKLFIDIALYINEQGKRFFLIRPILIFKTISKCGRAFGSTPNALLLLLNSSFNNR